MIIGAAKLADKAAILQLLRQIASCSNDIQHGPNVSNEKLLNLLEGCETFVLEQNGRLVAINAVQIVDLSRHPQAPYRMMAFSMVFGVEEIERRRGHGTSALRPLAQLAVCERRRFAQSQRGRLK